MICNVYPDTLSRLLLALCPNITSSNWSPNLSGVFLLSFPPFSVRCMFLSSPWYPVRSYLRFRWNPVCDCSVTSPPAHRLWHEHARCGIPEWCPWRKSAPCCRGWRPSHEETPAHVPKADHQAWAAEEAQLVGLLCLRRELTLTSFFSLPRPISVLHSGVDFCSLQALHLNCPELTDLNLNSCTNLHPGVLLCIPSALWLGGDGVCFPLFEHSQLFRVVPERLLLQCPKLEMVYASGCQNFLIGAVHDQVHPSIHHIICIILLQFFLATWVMNWDQRERHWSPLQGQRTIIIKEELKQVSSGSMNSTSMHYAYLIWCYLFWPPKFWIKWNSITLQWKYSIIIEAPDMDGVSHPPD